jgi:hypothetical protein
MGMGCLRVTCCFWYDELGCCWGPTQRTLRSILALRLIDCCCSVILPRFSLAASIWLAIIALCDIFNQSSFRLSVFDYSCWESLWGRRVCASDGEHRAVSLKSPNGVVVAPILLLVISIVNVQYANMIMRVGKWLSLFNLN